MGRRHSVSFVLIILRIVYRARERLFSFVLYYYIWSCSLFVKWRQSAKNIPATTSKFVKSHHLSGTSLTFSSEIYEWTSMICVYQRQKTHTNDFKLVPNSEKCQAHVKLYCFSSIPINHARFRFIHKCSQKFECNFDAAELDKWRMFLFICESFTSILVVIVVNCITNAPPLCHCFFAVKQLAPHWELFIVVGVALSVLKFRFRENSLERRVRQRRRRCRYQIELDIKVNK